MEQNNITFEDKIHKTMTWWRVPLMAAAFAVVIGFIHDIKFFWYGLPVSLLGELIQIWATSHLHKDKKFTISGPYSHVRNPMYFGRFFVGLGIFIMIGNIFAVVGYIIIYAVYGNLRVRREEKRLSQIFSPDYQHYCSEINRWFPRLKPYSRSESRRAKWAQVCVNHEQIVALGVLIVMVIIYLKIDRFPGWQW